MISKPKRSPWFSRTQKPRWGDRKKTRSTARLALETLEDRLTPATPGMGTAHFAVIGDFGAAGANEQAVASLVQSWNPAFIVSVGDNNYEFGGADTIDQNIGQYYSSYIAPYKGTYGPGASTNMFWPVLGNHDWETTGAAPYFGYFTLPGNGRYYKVSEGPIDFFMIDSNAEEPDGNGASSVQGAWLQAQLAQSTAPWKIVDFHHAPFSAGTEGSSAVMQWPFQQWGATAVISGHDHDYERFNINGIPYFVDGTGGGGLTDFLSGPLPNEVVMHSLDYGAMLVDASSSQITYQYITTAGTVIDTYTVNYPLPAAPTNLNLAQVSSGQINLTWTDSATNENGYSIERSTDGTNFTQIATVAPKTAQYLDSGLAGGTYYYRVTAFNAGGSSAYTNPTNVSMPLFQAPKSGTPSNLMVSPVMYNQFILTWTDNSGSQDSFSIERSTDGSNYTQIATMAPGTTHYMDSGLPSANYFYRIRGVDGSGNYTDYTNVVTGALTPAAPSGLAATSVSSQQINLNWTDNSNDETGFTISESTDGTNFTPLATVGATVTSYPVTGLISSSTYYFKVSAFNYGGSADSNSASATTNLAPPADASNLTATAVSSSQVNLSWTDNSTVPEEDGFKIFRSTDGINFVWAYLAGQNVTSYSVTGLSPGTTYYFYIKAYNAAGQAGPTNIANAATFPLPLAPSNLTATAASSVEIDLSWTNTDPTSQGTKIYKSSDGVNFIWSYTMAPGVTSYAVTGLAQTSTYSFYIASFNANGTSLFTSTASATTMTLPAAPSSLTGTAASSSQINLSWTNNAINPPASNFAIYQSTDGTNFTWSYTISASVTTYSVPGLASSTTYYFKVAASSQAGSSGLSNTVSAATQAAPQPPVAPSNLGSTVVSSTQINLSWTNNDATATGSKIYRSTDGINYTWAYTTSQGVGSYSITGLSPSTPYYFKVAAYNSVGNSAYSNTMSATTMAVPPAPSNLAGTVASSSQINLTWTNNDSSASGTKIYKSTDGVNFTWSYTMSQGVSSYSVTGLSASTTYYFKVAAYNSAGTSAFSGTVNATTMAVPANPTNLTATATSSSQINLAWTNNAVNPAATNIAIYKSTDGINFSWSYTVSPTASSFSATGLSASTTYYFRIRAYNSNGTSGYTNTSSASSSSSTAATSAPPAPSGLTATGVSSSQINLTWTNNATNQNGFTIQRSLDGTTFTTIATVGAGITSYSVTGLSASTTYYFQVSAYNPVGTSAFSNMASGATSAGTSELSGAFASNEVIVAGLGQTVGWSATLGAPLTVGVYVDNSDGSLTPAELARIADAVAVLNVSWNGSNGLQLVLVTDPARASIIVHTTGTTPAGGLKDGVLGDTEMAFIADPNAQMDDANPYTVFSGQQMVDIVQGWNWYTGSTQANKGMTAITSGQYDFESVVVHELGHAVGLYHDTAVYGMLNGDGYSTMYPLLYAGQTHRQVSLHDVGWLKHLYAYGPNPGSNEAPQPDDALRAWLPGSVDSLPFQSESGPTESLPLSQSASASSQLFVTLAPKLEAISLAPAGTFAPFQLGAIQVAPLPLGRGEFATTGRADAESLASRLQEAHDIAATPIVAVVPGAGLSQPASSAFGSALTNCGQALFDAISDSDPSGQSSTSEVLTPARSGEASNDSISIWDVGNIQDAPSTNGSHRQAGSLSELGDPSTSLWDQPSEQDGLSLPVSAALAVNPAAAAAVFGVLLSHLGTSSSQEPLRLVGGSRRKNPGRPS